MFSAPAHPTLRWPSFTHPVWHCRPSAAGSTAGSCTPALWSSPSPARWCHSSAPWRTSHLDPRSAPALAGSGTQTHTHTDNHTHSKPTWLWRVCWNTRTYAHRWEICRNIQTWPEHTASQPPTNTHPHALSGCRRHGNQVSISAHIDTHTHTHTHPGDTWKDSCHLGQLMTKAQWEQTLTHVTSHTQSLCQI